MVSLAQDCIDEQSIDPNCICISEYDPVCGCDGELYSNACEATQCNGVTYYVTAYDGNGNIIDCSTVASANSVCDSISVEVESFDFLMDEGEFVLTINMSTFFTSDDYFDYAGFVLLNSDGDVVAEEGIDAGNVYGFGAEYSDTRVLYFDEFVNLPFEGTLALFKGYFSGNEELACSFPISFSIDGAGVSLEGQYFSEEEYDYVQFSEDSLFIYDFEDEECYEFISFQYIANDSIIFLSNEEEEDQLLIEYSFEGSTLNLFNMDNSIELLAMTFDPSEWVECDDDISECTIFNVYAEASDCDSMGMVMIDIEFDVENQQSMGFNISGNGENYGSFDYGQMYYTVGPILADGETIYEFVIIDNDDNSCSDFTTLGPIECDDITSLNSLNKLSKNLLFIKNILGETVDKPSANSPYIYFYDDGSCEKKLILND